MTQAAATSSYVPGVCNINRAEIARRRMYGYVGITLLIIGLILLITLVSERWIRVLLFFPALLAASGMLQARNKFCVGYGAAGMQNADEGSTKALAIADAEALKKDKQKTRRINLESAGYALVATAIALALPVIS